MLWLMLPELPPVLEDPVMVSVKVPVVAFDGTLTVNLEVATPPGGGVTPGEENVAPTPLGAPKTLRLVALLKPFRLVTVTVADPDPPRATLKLLAERLKEKSGVGEFTVKLAAADAPPPGAGFTTVMESVPAEAISLAEIPAVT